MKSEITLKVNKYLFFYHSNFLCELLWWNDLKHLNPTQKTEDQILAGGIQVLHFLPQFANFQEALWQKWSEAEWKNKGQSIHNSSRSVISDLLLEILLFSSKFDQNVY